jgi:hypothetical protein
MGRSHHRRLMAGYSGTPLPKKLGLRADLRVKLVRMPPEVRAELRSELALCHEISTADGPIDFGMIFATSPGRLRTPFRSFTRRLDPRGMVWACWPKKSSGAATKIDEATVRAIGLEVGLVDVKICAVSETWSGLKFVRRLADRPTAG